MSAYILDVGHGNCAVIRDDCNALVIDAGPGSSLLEFLKSEGVSSIDTLLISHADKDHIAGLIGLLSTEEFEVRKVRLNTDSHKTSQLWDDLTYLLSHLQNIGDIDFDVSLTVKNSEEYNFGQFTIEILAPSTYLAAKGPGSKDRNGKIITTNSISTVIKVVHGNLPILLFTGDIDNVGLTNLIAYLSESGGDARAPVLIFPHHGGRAESDLTDFTQQLCECVRPNTVVFSIGRGRYSTPQPRIVETIKSYNSDARILCTQLSEHCASQVPDDAASHLTGVFAAGKSANLCCAGTIVITVDNETLSVSPFAEGHQAFISSTAPTALCSRR